MTATNQPGSSQERPTHTVVVPNSIDMVVGPGPGRRAPPADRAGLRRQRPRPRQPHHARRRVGRGRHRRAPPRRDRDAGPHRPGRHRRDGRADHPDAAHRDAGAPGRRAEPQHPVQPRSHDPAQDGQPEALRRVDRQEHDHLRHRPGRHRQDLPGDGQGRAGAAGQGGQPDHPQPPGRRGGGAARVPARHAQREDRPLPAPALRRAARHGRPRDDPQAARRRHHRGRPAGVPARPVAQRLVHHPRRGAEHHARADEDVPHPPRLRLTHRRHRRHQPGRPARPGRSRASGSSRASSTASTTSPSAASPAPTWCGTASWVASWRPTRSSTPTTSAPGPKKTERSPR